MCHFPRLFRRTRRATVTTTKNLLPTTTTTTTGGAERERAKNFQNEILFFWNEAGKR